MQTWLVISGIFDFQPYDHIWIDPQFSKHIFHMKPPIRHKYMDQPLYPHLHPLCGCFFFITVISHEILIFLMKKSLKCSTPIFSMEFPRILSRKVAAGVDNTIRILSLERERPLKQLSAQVPRRKPRDIETWRTEEGYDFFLENNDPERMFEIVLNCCSMIFDVFDFLIFGKLNQR